MYPSTLKNKTKTSIATQSIKDMPPILRIDGDLVPLKEDPLSEDDLKHMILGVIADAQKTQFDGNVVFNTVPVTVELNNSTGGDELANFKYYSGGWKTIGSGNDTTIVSVELLPKRYNFKAFYAGASKIKSQFDRF